jgi:amino acid permease
VALLLAAIIAINYFGVGVFGEFEFYLSSIKVLIILGFIIFTLVIAAGGGPKDHPKGFHYVRISSFAPSYHRLFEESQQLSLLTHLVALSFSPSISLHVSSRGNADSVMKVERPWSFRALSKH